MAPALASPTAHAATTGPAAVPAYAATPPAVAAAPPDIPEVEGTSSATAARAHEATVPRARGPAGGAVNREIHIGDVVVELGEPLPPQRSIERAGSLLASLPRPTLRPRRRL